MPAVVLAVAGPLDARTGGSIYNRRMAEGLRARGWTVDARELDGDFPQPSAAALEAAERMYAALPDRCTVLADGLALSAMPDTIERHGRRLRVVALVHLPIAATVGLDKATAARLAEWEQRALGAATRVVVTGRGAWPLLERYGLDRRTLTLVEPGVEPAPLARGSNAPVVRLLSVATVNAGKGHDVLLRALASLDSRSAVSRGAASRSAGTSVPAAHSASRSAGTSVPANAWHLTCAGSLTRDSRTAARVRALATELGLESRVTFAGDLDGSDLARAWDYADLFVLATLRETYGMAVAEALARGLPVVSTVAGAIPSLVGEDAGLLVPPGHVEALESALGRVITDPEFRARLAAGARRVRDRLPTWDDAVGKMATTLEGCDHG
ncbi:MAG TPA: glycosyltransferase family 4 protein [Vicinamibacterales bacterium]|nr:glycosyltransferase family 4 protein [Vicinamibacterales bacterium]